MKKVIVLAAILFLLTGCVNIRTSKYEDIINEATHSKLTIYNTYRNGYKFYLPKGMYISSKTEYNETIKNGRENYYLYIDLINYLDKKENAYEKNDTALYSASINNAGKSGYIEINQKSDKYLVEIMYNYAKIEVMVNKEDISSAVANASVILSSVYYNDGILESLSRENVLSYSEETIDIFKTKGRDNSNFLQYVEEYDEEETEVPDYDLIN